MEFEWDLAKELANIAKHGYNFAETVEAFRDLDGLMLADKAHSSTESRHYWVGKTANGRVVTVRFTRRGAAARCESLGCAEWRKFRSLYYETTKTR